MALVIAALGAPASASVSKGAIAVVNGIPGTKVDICINGREIKSRVGYGGKILKLMSPGSKTLKVFKPDPRRCRGTKLAQKRFTLTANDNAQPDGDLTIVVTRRKPMKVVIFDNTGAGQIPPTGAPFDHGKFFWRHAADLGPVDFYYRNWEPNPEFQMDPAADPFTKGDEDDASALADYLVQLRVTRVGQTGSITRPKRVDVVASHRYEWIVLGTKVRNARIVVLDRAVSKYLF
jgi:hypothetical protein